jgi:hypothetical protein
MGRSARRSRSLTRTPQASSARAPVEARNRTGATSRTGHHSRWRGEGGVPAAARSRSTSSPDRALGRRSRRGDARRNSSSSGSLARCPPRLSHRVKPRRVDSMRATVASDQRPFASPIAPMSASACSWEGRSRARALAPSPGPPAPEPSKRMAHRSRSPRRARSEFPFSAWLADSRARLAPSQSPARSSSDGSDGVVVRPIPRAYHDAGIIPVIPAVVRCLTVAGERCRPFLPVRGQSVEGELLATAPAGPCGSRRSTSGPVFDLDVDIAAEEVQQRHQLPEGLRIVRRIDESVELGGRRPERSGNFAC